MRKSFTILCTFLFIMHLGASELSPLYYNPFKKEFRQSQFEPDPRHKEKNGLERKGNFWWNHECQFWYIYFRFTQSTNHL